MNKISIIIALYNAENTISKCLDSLLNQSYNNFEIIVVNDGSTDNSLKILEDYRSKDDRIIVFNNDNHGPAFSRNFAIKKATGKYITFIDSDDFLDDSALKYMLDYALKTGADIVSCGYYKVTGGETFTISAKSGIYHGAEINSALIELKSKDLIDPLWNKLYNADFIKETGLFLPENELYEDTDFNLRLLKFNPVYAISDRCFYHYVLHMGSVTRKYNPDKLDTIKNRARLLKEVSAGLDSYCDFYYIKSVFSSIMDAFLSLNKKDIISIIRKEINSAEFREKSKNACFNGLTAKAIIFFAKSGSTAFVYFFCKISYLLKYKNQKLFMKVN